MSLLELHAVRAGYGGIAVLWDFSLDIDEGEVFCLLGRNGAGKTTLAHTVTGLMRTSGGRILFAGRDITRRTPEARAKAGISLVPQGRRVFADLTVAENLRVAGFAARGRTQGWGARLAVALFPLLSQLGARLAGTLSGGEQQMVAMGRALAAEPALLVLDEPSLGLAPIVVKEMYAAIAELKQERRISMLLIEQQVGGALAVADRVGILDTGNLQSVVAGQEADLTAIVGTYLGDPGNPDG